MASLRAIHIYDGSRAGIINYNSIIKYIQALLPSVSIDVREEAELLGNINNSAHVFAQCRLRDLYKGITDRSPLPVEIDYEFRRLSEGNNRTYGILYEGVLVADYLSRNILESEKNMAHLHIYVTNQLMGTFDDKDRRFHARYAIFSYPSIISTTGIVVAPARPREYYILKQQFKNLASDEIFDTMIREKIKDRMIDYDDERINDVMKGLILQCVFFHETGEPFCERRDCRLFNAHWQEELILSQTGPESGLCPDHLEFATKNFSQERKNDTD
jgi:hypothetical protein